MVPEKDVEILISALEEIQWESKDRYKSGIYTGRIASNALREYRVREVGRLSQNR